MSSFLGAHVSEFINIWALEGDASLNLKTSGGLATVSFNCTLGHPGASHFPPPPSSPVFTSVTVANNASVASSSPLDTSLEASTEENEPVNVSEVFTVQFKCDQCSYINTTNKGLRQHIRMKHKISQLDGINDSFVKEDVGIQTNDSLTIVPIEDVGEDCEEEYIGETFWRLPSGFYFDHWHTESARRAPPGFWVNRVGDIMNIKTGEVIGKVS